MVTAGGVAVEWSTFGSGLTFEIPDALAGISAAIEALGGGAAWGMSLVSAAVAANPFADLTGFVIGVALLLIALAISILVLRPLGMLLSHVPLVGGALQDAVDGASNAVWNFVTGLVHNGLLMIWHLIRILWACTFGLPGTVAQLAGAVAGAIVWIRNDLIPWVRTDAQQMAAGAEHAAEQFAASEANAVSNFARTLFAEATAEAVSLYHQAVTIAEADVNAARYEAGQLFNEARTEAVQLVRGAEAAATAGIAAAVSTAEHLFGQAEADVASAERSAQTALEGAVSTLTGLFTGAITATTATLTQDITVAREEAATATRTVEQEFQDYMKRCGIPVCNGLRGMADEMLNLLQVLDDAAVFALLALLLTNPKAAVDIIRDVFVLPAQDVATLIRQAA